MSNQQNSQTEKLFLELMQAYSVQEPLDIPIQGLPLAMPSFGQNAIAAHLF